MLRMNTDLLGVVSKNAKVVFWNPTPESVHGKATFFEASGMMVGT